MKAVYFPAAWKKANVVPSLKKGNKQIANNYRPASLLPICSKLFETIFQHLMESKLLKSVRLHAWLFFYTSAYFNYP